MEEMTRGQKAAQTAKERKDRERDEAAALRNDRERELQVLRLIRDSDKCFPRDRIEAIRLLREIRKDG